MRPHRQPSPFRLLIGLLAGSCALLGTASADAVGDLIARGRAALEAGRAEEAQRIFEEAAAKDAPGNGESLRTRLWVIRSWMDQGRINDSLDAIDAIDKAGAKGPPIDYLYGMAFAAKARDYIRSEVGGSAVQMSIDDAVQFLDRATKADPELARDAFLPLAEAAWYGRRLDVARPAAEEAVRRLPSSADAHFALGRVALSQYSQGKDDEATRARADADWEVARTAFACAAELLGQPADPAGVEKLARVRTNLGHAYAWKEKLDLAGREYAQALAWKQSLVDLRQVRAAIGGERFLAALESASQALAARPAAEVSDVASLTWWLGWSRYEQKQYEKADEAFSAAVAKYPAYVNSWFYIALSRYHRRDYEGALAALRRHWDENPTDLVAALSEAGGDPELNLRVLDFLVGWCAEKERPAEAALLSEMQAAAAPEVSRYWNNSGLFWRDAGEALTKSDRPEEEKKQAAEWFEKSWQAYSKALEIEPDNPAYLNDAAVILHYYLDREGERAKEMYRKAAERARIELQRKDLAPAVRELYETALRDSTDNLGKLADKERGEKRP